MSYYADIYVIKKTRSKKLGLEFLNNFLPFRKESTDEYLIPQFSDNPIKKFHKAEDIMDYLEQNKNFYQSLYWSNSKTDNPNAHGMLFYTEDGYMIFGISRSADEVKTIRKPEECLSLMTSFLQTNNGYITYECPPESTYKEFLKKVESIE